jgi:DNA anti-recombination protein RmuC
MEINEAKLKDILTEQRTEFQHVVGIFKKEHLESQIQAIGEQLGAITEDIQVIKSDIEIIKIDLRRKVDYDEFNALAKRVSLIESKIRK